MADEASSQKNCAENQEYGDLSDAVCFQMAELAGGIIFIFIWLSTPIFKSLSMLNQALISGACCCLQCCCKEVGETLFKIIGRVSFIKIMYSLIYFAFIGFVYLAMYLLKEWQFFMRVIADGINCQNLTNQFDCVSASVIYRITISLFMFSTLMLITMLVASTRVAHIVNQGLFFTKFIITVILFFVTLQIDNSVMSSFSDFCQIFSYVFIVWQIVIVIDLSYLWGIRWAEKYAEGSRCHGCLLIFFSGANYVVAIGINVYGYILSTSDQEGACSNYQNILASVMIVGLFLIQLLNFNKQNSLLATSALTVFNAYWLLSAIFSKQQCNNSLIFSQGGTAIGKSDFLKINIPISCLFVLISSFGSIYGSSNKEEEGSFIELRDVVDMQKKLKPQQEESMVEEKQMWIRWHVFMMAMSLYISMVLTDWGSGDIIKGKFKLTANAEISKIFTACVCFLIYSWTLLAPKFFPNRNFYFQ